MKHFSKVFDDLIDIVQKRSKIGLTKRNKQLIKAAVFRKCGRLKVWQGIARLNILYISALQHFVSNGHSFANPHLYEIKSINIKSFWQCVTFT